MTNVQKLIDQYPTLLSVSNSVDNAVTIKSIASSNDYSSDDIVVCTNTEYLTALLEKKVQPAALIIPVNMAELAPEHIPTLTSVNPRLAQALIKQQLNDYTANDNEWDSPHKSATIHSSATIGENCRIGPNVIIGKNVVIGNNTIIRSNSIVEHGTNIGDNCVIHSLVNIGYNSEVGDNVIIRPGAIIGNEGFGFAPDENKAFHRLPHTGKVILESQVHIGANCNIDRGTYGETRIKKGTKLDSLCHVAHNVEIGEHCVITSQCVIAGSSKIGNHVMMSGQSGVLDHVTIPDGVTLIHRAGVLQDIPETGVWGGLPAKPFKEHVKRNTLDKSIDKKIAKLEARLQKLENK